MESSAEVGDDTFWELTTAVGRQALRITELEALLATHDVGSSTARTASGRGHPLTAIPSTSNSSFDSFARAYSDLYVRHEKLRDAHAGCEKRIRHLSAKYNEAKEGVKLWHQYITRKRRDGWRTSRESCESPTVTATSFNKAPEENLNNEPGLLAASGRLPEHTQGDVAELPQVPDEQGQASTANCTSSQTTVVTPEKEAQPSPKVKREPMHEDDDDGVVFVSARGSKRRKISGNIPDYATEQIKQEPPSPTNFAHGNFETAMGPARPPSHLKRNETSDLDAIGSILETPRRPRISHRSNLSAFPNDTANATLVPVKAGLSPDATPRNIFPPNDSRVPSQEKGLINALRPISANVPVNPRSAGRSPSQSSFRRIDDDKIAIVAEDGPDGSAKTARQVKHDSYKTRKSKGGPQSVVDSMLNNPTPTKSALSRLPPSARHYTALTPPQSAKTASTRSAVNASFPKKAAEAGSQQSCSETTSAHGLSSLRSKPLSDLRLDHFIINPDYLGSTFAFADSIRGKEQRKHLHTCTEPGCCGGALRKAIEMGGPSLSGKTDLEVLRAYLGPDWEVIIRPYDDAKRRDVVLQSHAFSFANQHGKHRQAFERQRSPPGFWNTDFPTTQQAFDDREKALQMERQKVEERWREALREGGRWKFRDE